MSKFQKDDEFKKKKNLHVAKFGQHPTDQPRELIFVRSPPPVVSKQSHAVAITKTKDMSGIQQQSMVKSSSTSQQVRPSAGTKKDKNCY